MYRDSEKVFQLFKQFLSIPYNTLPLETRVNAATSIAQNALFNSPKVFKMALEENPISADAIAMQVPWSGTLLHGVATAIGSIMSRETYLRLTTRSYEDLPGTLMNSLLLYRTNCGTRLASITVRACNRRCRSTFSFKYVLGRRSFL